MLLGVRTLNVSDTTRKYVSGTDFLIRYDLFYFQPPKFNFLRRQIYADLDPSYALSMKDANVYLMCTAVVYVRSIIHSRCMASFMLDGR